MSAAAGGSGRRLSLLIAACCLVAAGCVAPPPTPAPSGTASPSASAPAPAGTAAPSAAAFTNPVYDTDDGRIDALAIEPMTCPPDAFNSGVDLDVIEPGESLVASWDIFGIAAR